MVTRYRPLTLLFGAAVASIFATSIAHATVTGVIGSNVDAYFGSQSDAYQDSNPVGLNPWPAVGPGPYLGSALPGVPLAPTGTVAPSNVTTFAPAASSSSFNDGFGNTANSSILAFAVSSPGFIDDAQIGLSMSLTQSTSTAGTASYAYEQLNYDVDYSLVNVLNSAGTLTGALGGLVTRSFNVSGNVGSFVDFGGKMNFWDVPTAGSPTLLGSLVFSYNNVVGGPFAATVTGSGVIGGGTFVNSPDILRITGQFFIAGDPSTISVQSVPEPSTLSLLGIAGVGLLTWIRRRRS